MELQQERPPSYPHDDTLNLPSVPTHELAPPATHSSALHLPALQSLGLPESQPTFTQFQPSAEKRGAKWQNGSLPVSAFPSTPSGALRASVETPLYSPTTEAGSDEHGNRAQSVVSMDDAETRMAAEALSGLRNPGMSVQFFHLCDTVSWRSPHTSWPFISLHMSHAFHRRSTCARAADPLSDGCSKQG
jgi:hypothetical protein